MHIDTKDSTDFVLEPKEEQLKKIDQSWDDWGATPVKKEALTQKTDNFDDWFGV